MTTRKPLSEAARLDFQALAERIQTHKGINGHKPLSNNRIAEKDDIKKGAFHKWLGKKPDSPITNADIEKGLKSNDAHVRKMAQFAKNMRESVRAALRLPIAERFYIVSDKGAVLEDNGGHGFESIEEAKRWFGQQTKILGRLGIGAPDAQRFGQAIRAGTELVGEATDIDLSGFASDKTEPLKALLKSHGVEHEIQGSKLHLHNSEDAHFVVDAMADIEAGHTPPTTEAREGEYEVAYVDNNGRKKRKSFKTDAAREKWITNQGSNIEVDSYRDPEPTSKTERAAPGSFPKGGDSLTLDQWKNAILSVKPSALFDPSGDGCEAWEDPARTIPLGYWGSPEYENEWLIDMTGYGEGISGAVERQGRQEGSRSNSANRIMRGKGYKQVGEADDTVTMAVYTADGENQSHEVEQLEDRCRRLRLDFDTVGTTDERPGQSDHGRVKTIVMAKKNQVKSLISLIDWLAAGNYDWDDPDGVELESNGSSTSVVAEGSVDLTGVSYEDLCDEIVRRMAMDLATDEDGNELELADGLQELHAFSQDDPEVWDGLHDYLEQSLDRLMKQNGVGESGSSISKPPVQTEDDDDPFSRLYDGLAAAYVEQIKGFAQEDGEPFADDKEAIASAYEQIVMDSSSWEDVIDSLGDAFERMYGGRIPGGPGSH